MAKIIGLPKLSPTMDEGTLVRWVKNEGDRVEVDDLLAEVETDKATMEFRSFDRGVLLKRLVPEGTTLAPDTPVAIIGDAGEDISSLATSAPVASNGVPVGAPDTPTNAEPVAVSAPREATSAIVQGRVLASPLVRRLARERGVDLGGLRGSGPGGRIVKRDLDGLRAAIPNTRAPVAMSRSVKLSSMRKTIARRLSESKRDVPHFYLTVTLDAEPIAALREQLNEAVVERGIKVSVNDLLIKASALALRDVPEVNASFAGDSLTFHERVDISVAVAVPDGLVTPVVRNADRKSVLEIAAEVRELAARAKDKRLRPEEMTDGTFSVSNLGMFGVEHFAAVINPPEGAILAVGTVVERPVVRGGAVVAGRTLTVTMSCDHRVVDGALGARWLQAFRRRVERPVSLLLD